MQAPTLNRITQGQHLASKAVDHGWSPDPMIYAPEDGKITYYGQAGRPGTTNDAGIVVRLQGKTGLHQFAHIMRGTARVKVGQSVKQGQPLALMGETGYTFGRHLHYWVKTPRGYVYPPTLYRDKFISKGDTQVFQNLTEVKQAYRMMRGKYGTTAEMKPWVGKSKQAWIKAATKETDNQRANATRLKKQLASVKKALAAEKKKPPKTVIKEVEKIVEKKVEVPVEKIVYTHDEETKQQINTIFGYFMDRWKTFNAYFKKGR